MNIKTYFKFLIFLSIITFIGTVLYFLCPQKCAKVLPVECYYIYFNNDKITLQKFFENKTDSFTSGHLFDFSILILGICWVIWIIWWAKEQEASPEKTNAEKKRVIGDQIVVALVGFVAFLMYGLVTYDLKTEKCDLAPMYYEKEPDPKKNTDANIKKS